jgi:hypothetical protein
MLICLGQSIDLLVLVTEVRFRFQVVQVPSFPYHRIFGMWSRSVPERDNGIGALDVTPRRCILRENIAAWESPIGGIARAAPGPGEEVGSFGFFMPRRKRGLSM